MLDAHSHTLDLTVDPTGHRTVHSLNGIWEFSPGVADSLPTGFLHQIRVPSVVDTARPALAWEKEDFFYYRLRFRLSGLAESSLVVLQIGQAQFGTQVYVNGVPLGGSIACYTSQRYRIDDALRRDAVNELVVRVGAKRALPPESAVGRDQEKDVYTPGIWGDVSLISTHQPFIENIQVLPHIQTNVAEIRVAVSGEGLSGPALVRVRVRERLSGRSVSRWIETPLRIDGCEEGIAGVEVPITECRPWSPEDPFLYVAEVEAVSGKYRDCDEAVFGMREFRIVDGHFQLNGRKILLRGGNIAFHRFLADPERAELPWDPNWIRTVLVDIPRAHHFNFFRFHLGHAYNRWYDVADEHGILLQDEWHFWGATGTDRQIRAEFKQWLRDNWNHPSIVIWDPLNESTDATVQTEIVPEMKLLDPTRPWESVDFREQHPYVYSLCMTYANRPIGFTDSLDSVERSMQPKVINEFLWWWFDSTWKPTMLMKGVLERWLGKRYDLEDIRRHMVFLTNELVELFRRIGADAIQPFVYLSNNTGPTAHWFEGPLREFRPKPVLGALKNAFAPFGVSVELWDRHFEPSQDLLVRIFVFNDTLTQRRGTIRLSFVWSDSSPEVVQEVPVAVAATDRQIVERRVRIAPAPGVCTLRCELLDSENRLSAVSEKPVYIVQPPELPSALRNRRIWLEDPSGEVTSYLQMLGLAAREPGTGTPDQKDVVFLNAQGLFADRVVRSCEQLGMFVRAGGTLIIQEPEFRVIDDREAQVIPGLSLRISRRHDVDKGGYDSYVFPEDPGHALWKGIAPDHLKIWNGGVGGEMVSEYSVESSLPVRVLARCGLGLEIPAVFEIPVERGRVMVSRIQIRGRVSEASVPGPLFSRRADPVAKRYLVNLLML